MWVEFMCFLLYFARQLSNFAVFKHVFQQTLGYMNSFPYFYNCHPADCLQWDVGVNLSLGSILWKRRLLRFTSDKLEIRDFQQKNLRKEQGGRLHLACIYMAQMRPFVMRGCILCYPYIHFWRRLLYFLLWILRFPNTFNLQRWLVRNSYVIFLFIDNP